MTQQQTHTIEAVTIASLSSRQYIDDEETGESYLDPVYGNRSSIELMLPEGASLPRLPLGGVWRVKLVGGHGHPDHPADPRSAREEQS